MSVGASCGSYAVKWSDGFLAYSRIGRVIGRVGNESGLALVPKVFVPTLTNAIMSIIEEHGLNFHSPTPAHLMRACQDCNWGEHDKHKEDYL
jgi:hypothetical protein